jgi:hypothetical protein
VWSNNSESGGMIEYMNNYLQPHFSLQKKESSSAYFSVLGQTSKNVPKNVKNTKVLLYARKRPFCPGARTYEYRANKSTYDIPTYVVVETLIRDSRHGRRPKRNQSVTPKQEHPFLLVSPFLWRIDHSSIKDNDDTSDCCSNPNSCWSQIV